MWAYSGLLGLYSGGALAALMAATTPLLPLGGAAGTSRTPPILLLAALPPLLVVGWTVVRDWRRGARGVGKLICHALTLALVAGALPLSGYWLSRAVTNARSDFFFLIGGLTTPGLSIALAAGFAFGELSRDEEGWPNADEAGRSAGMGCLGGAAFLLVVEVITGIIAVIQAFAPAPPLPPGTRFNFSTREVVPFVVFLALLWLGSLNLLLAPIVGLLGGYLRGEPPLEE